MRVSGFNTASYKQITMTYETAAWNKGVENQITLSTDKGDIEVPLKTLVGGNKFETVTVTLPVGFTWIQFTSKADTNHEGFRIDNIKVIAK